MPTVNHAELNKAAQKYRKELLIMAVIGLGTTLEHMTLRTGIRYKETVGEMDGPVELMPYTGLTENEGYENDGIEVDGRDLETFLGQVYKEYDPNKLVQTLYGASVTNGKALENIDFNLAILTLMVRKISGGLNQSIFNAVRNNAGKTTKTLYNGLDTITAAEIVAGKIATGNNNLLDFTEAITKNNAVDALKLADRACSDELKSEARKMFLPWNVYNAYNDDYQQTVGAVPYNQQFQKTFLEGSNNMCELVPLIGKKDAPYLQITTKGNTLVGVNQVGDEEKFEVRRGNNPWKIQFSGTMFFGTQWESISPEKLLVGKFFTAPQGG